MSTLWYIILYIDDVKWVCEKTIKCIERDYTHIPVTEQILLMSQRFWSDQPDLNAHMDNMDTSMTGLTERMDLELNIRAPLRPIPLPVVQPSNSINVSIESYSTRIFTYI